MPIQVVGTGMTTALIGKEGATAAKARVAVVTRGGVSGLAAHILGSGHEIQEFSDWPACLEAIAVEPLDLVFFDDEAANGLPERLDVPAVHVTERGSSSTRAGLGVIPGSALEAALEPLLAMAIELRMATSRCHDLEQLADGVRSGSAIVGRSPVMRRLQGVISRAADCDATMLIEGPAGAGKSLAARVIHCKSRRSGKALRIIDGAALDAETATAVIAEARGTTLVVEDIDRIPAAGQAVLVRHLKERSGARADQAPRLIATTHAHLPELVARGAFREDLYYRLNGFPMVVPSLRERTEDIAEIAQAILATGAAQSGRVNAGCTASALATLEAMPWPGNVAQLEVVLKRAQALAGGAPVDREHLLAQPAPMIVPHSQNAAEHQRRDDPDAEITEAAIRPFEEEEQLLLTRALRATKGNVRRAAQLLGIGRATLYRKIQQYKLRLQ
jgi:DNA-binding NtrC family response regulator